jgi:hypothetical protein
LNRIHAQEGNDLLNGGNGNDTLSGDEGFDILTGGAGKDTFQYISGGNRDFITDFNLAAAAGDEDLLSFDPELVSAFSATADFSSFIKRKIYARRWGCFCALYCIRSTQVVRLRAGIALRFPVGRGVDSEKWHGLLLYLPFMGSMVS